MLQAMPIVRRGFLCSALSIFSLSVFWSGVVLALPDVDELKLLASSAGKYTAWRDICGDPDGADIRSDFLARVESLAPEEQADLIEHFEKWYARKKKNGEVAVKGCIRQGRSDCCTVGPSRQILGAKNLYDSHVASLDVAEVPTESAAAAPAPTVSSVTSRDSVVAAPASPTPSAPPLASRHIPATQAALDRLYGVGGIYAGWAAACDEPVTVRQDYMEAANSLAPADRDKRINWFDGNYQSAVDRVTKTQKAMSADAGTRGGDVPDPCTRDTLNQHKEKYESTLLAVQKADAAAKSQAAASASTAGGSSDSAESSVAAHDPGTGTLTVDGETRSFVFEKCIVMSMGGGTYRVRGDAKGDAGFILKLDLLKNGLSVSVLRDGPENTNTRYLNRGYSPAEFRVDGSTVTVDGDFQTSSFPVTGHSIQLSFDCSV